MPQSTLEQRSDDGVEVLKVPDFRRLWFANGLRDSGGQVASFALPITALVLLHARPLEMSLIFAASRLGYLLVGLPAGVWIDRWPRKLVLVWADVAYAAAFGSIPAAYLLGVLTVPQLILVAFAVSVAGVFFDTAHSSVLPQLLPKRRVADANARLQSTDTASQAIAPSVAGALTQSVAAPLLYCFATLCHLGSVLLVRGIRPVGEPTRESARSGAEPERHFRKEVVDGVRILLSQPLLRLLLSQAALNNLGAGILLSMMPVFLLKQIGVAPWLFGLLSTLGAVAGFTASLVGPALRRRIGEIRMMLVFSALAPLALLPAPLATVFRGEAVALAALAEVLIGFVVVARAVATAGLRARVTPTRFMGRVTSANNFVTQGATPLGALLGGVVADSCSIGAALWVGVAEMAVAVLLLAVSPMRRHRTLPSEWEV